MTIIQVAGITAALDNRHPDTAWLCRDYLSEEAPVLTLRVTEEELAAERAAAEAAKAAAKKPEETKKEEITHFSQIVIFHLANPKT